MTIEVLNWLELPGSLGIERDRIVRMKFQNADFEFRNTDFDEGYDFHTLFYDVIFVPQSRSICLICPKLLNLSAVVTDRLFVSKDQKFRPRIMYQHGRYDEIWLRSSDVPDRLRVRFGSFDCEVPVSIQDREIFKGLRCAVLKSKENELAWIKDWAEYHVKVHGLQGLVFFDNGSEKYSTEDVHNALLEINGLEKVRVLSAPFPFGPLPNPVYKYSFSKFLIDGLLNIARLRYFQSAASVLATDIDELVAPTPEGSVFALAERSLFGYVAFQGRWRYPQPTDTRHIRHVDHAYGSNDGICRYTKYCICPRGPLRFLRWGTHGVHAGPHMKAAIEKALTTSRIEYWHCRKISTNWKYLREVPPSNQLKLDTGTKRVLDRVFGSGP